MLHSKFLPLLAMPFAASALHARFAVAARQTAAMSSSRLVFMNADPPDALETDVELDPLTVEAVASAAAEVDVIASEPVEVQAKEYQLDKRHAPAGDRDASVAHQREAASFFDSLLNERESCTSAKTTPIEETVKDKIRKMSFLQSELEYVIALGLQSKAREQWIENKMLLEEKKRVVKQQWVRGRAERQHESPTHRCRVVATSGLHALPRGGADRVCVRVFCVLTGRVEGASGDDDRGV